MPRWITSCVGGTPPLSRKEKRMATARAKRRTRTLREPGASRGDAEAGAVCVDDFRSEAELARQRGAKNQTLNQPCVDYRGKRRMTTWQMLVWAYARQLVRVGERLGADPEGLAWWRGNGACGCALVERAATFGTTDIDWGGGDGTAFVPRDLVHPDARRLHWLVRGLYGEDAAIMLLAEAGEEPVKPVRRGIPRPTIADRRQDVWRRGKWGGRKVDVKIDGHGRVADRLPPQMEPYTDRNGRQRLRRVQRAVSVEVVSCPIDWYPNLDVIEHAETMHRLWRDQLAGVRAQIGKMDWPEHEIIDAGGVGVQVTEGEKELDNGLSLG